jgi:hypothetical protein
MKLVVRIRTGKLFFVAETKMTLMGLVDRLHKRKLNACLNSNP